MTKPEAGFASPTDEIHLLDQKLFRLWVMLSQVYYAMKRAVEIELVDEKTTFEQASVMLVVSYLGEKATPAKIAQWLLRERNSTTGLLNRMVKQGLVTKHKDLARKNMKRIALTEKGIDAYHRSYKWSVVYDVFETLSLEEREQLRGMLRKLRGKAFGKVGVDSRSFFI